MVNWDIVSGIAASFATVISLVAVWLATKSQSRMDRLAHQSWTDAYFRDIASWAGEVCQSISAAIHLVEIEDDVARRQVLIRLSAAIDMGRWFFPNHAFEEYGLKKEPAYRGVRQPLLDWIVRAYDICRGEVAQGNAHSSLVECQRQFVSAIQEVIDPRQRSAQIKRVQDDFKSVSGLPKVVSPPK